MKKAKWYLLRIFTPLEKATDFSRWLSLRSKLWFKATIAHTVRERSSLTGFIKIITLSFFCFSTFTIISFLYAEESKLRKSISINSLQQEKLIKKNNQELGFQKEESVEKEKDASIQIKGQLRLRTYHSNINSK